MINRSWLPLFVAGFAASANAQMSAQETLFDNLETWRAEHGQTWRVDVDEGTGFAEFLYGGSAPAAFQPTSDSEWFSAARAALAQTAALHGIEAGTLVEERALYLPLGMTGSTDKMTLRLRQFVSGVPVEGGAVNVLFDATGRLLSVQTRDGQRLAVHASGAMRVAVVRLVVGDAVRIERSPFDGGKGRIVGIDRGYPARVRTAPNEHRQPQIDRVEIQP